MDSMTSIVLRRSELYQRVWETPMVKPAAELGLSGVGLAKLCRRSGIPVPRARLLGQASRGPSIQQPGAAASGCAIPQFPSTRAPGRSAPRPSPRRYSRSPQGPALSGGPVVVAEALEHPH